MQSLGESFPSINVEEEFQDVSQVDISVDDIKVSTIHDEIECSIVDALEKWNAIDNAALYAEIGRTGRARRMKDTLSGIFGQGESSKEHVELRSILENIVTLDGAIERRSGTTELHEFVKKELNHKKKHPVRTLCCQSIVDAFVPTTLSSEMASVPENELVFQVELRHRHGSKQTMRLLGSQTLAELSDALYCAMNDALASHKRRSNYFHIGKTFYLDQRHPDNIDYTRPIREWIAERPVRSATYGSPINPVRDTATTELKDLQIQLDQPYLYCHQGNCQHILLFTRVQLHHPQDDQNKNRYPLRRLTVSSVSRCSICHVFPARHICLNNDLAATNPSLFCDRCYFIGHYTKEGQLAHSNFQVYPFIH